MRLLLCAVLATAMSQVPDSPKRMDTRALEQAIAQFQGTVGLAVRDLRTGEEIAINGDQRFPTASVIKTAVMVEAYARAADGSRPLDARLALTRAHKVGGSGVLNGMTDGLSMTVRDLVHLMVVLSDNAATNMLVEHLGTKNIDERMVALGLASTKIFRPTFRDGRADIYPELEREFGLGMSTTREMARLMAAIAEGRAVDAAASKEMLATLQRQQDRAMIPRLLPAGVEVGNKTGTDSEKLADERGHRGAIRTDAAVVSGANVHYAIAIFIRRGEDTRGGVDNAAVVLGAKLSRMVYDMLAQQAG